MKKSGRCSGLMPTCSHGDWDRTPGECARGFRSRSSWARTSSTWRGRWTTCAHETGRTTAEIPAALDRGRARLFEVRATRPRPHLDDKILTAWNGLMIAACARAARVAGGFVGDEEAGRAHLEAARRAAGFIRRRMWTGRTLSRRYRSGEARIEGYAEDYAYLVAGLIELFQADPDPVWLDWALDLQERQDELFWDAAAGGWFSTSGADPAVLLRLKDDYDGAEPAVSSVSVMNLVMLTHLVAREDWQEKIERTLEFFGERLDTAGRAVPMMAAALSAHTAGVQQVVVVGDDAARRELDRVVAFHYLPFAVVLSVDSRPQQRLAARLPLVAAMNRQAVGRRCTCVVTLHVRRRDDARGACATARTWRLQASGLGRALDGRQCRASAFGASADRRSLGGGWSALPWGTSCVC